jgi:ubiquinone/menaquinone biosynthesis C-methylase UbiE
LAPRALACAALDSIPSLMPASSPVADHFRKNAPLDRHQSFRHRAVLGMLRGLEGRVLDYGCGYGDLTYAISKSNPVLGVDVDPERVAFAAKEYAPISFRQCRADGLDLPDAEFDIVTSVVVLPFVPDPDDYLAEIARVLKPGGYLIIAARNVPLLTRAADFVRQRLLRRKPPTRLFCTSPGQVRDLLVRHGFQVLRRGAFYDPPFERRESVVDLINGAIALLDERLRLGRWAPYPLFLARRSTMRGVSQSPATIEFTE